MISLERFREYDYMKSGRRGKVERSGNQAERFRFAPRSCKFNFALPIAEPMSPENSPSGPTRLDAVRFLDVRTPRQIFPGRPILEAIFLDPYHVEYDHTKIKCNAVRYYVTVNPKSANQKI